MNSSLDLDLARRVADGDENALRTLYQRYADMLFAYIFHLLDGDRQDVEDLWQETWIAAIQAIPGYKGRSRLFTWLCGIARRKTADHFRRRGVQEVAQSPEMLEEAGRLMDAAPLPEEMVIHRDTRMRVVEALEALPENYRRVLVERYGDECSVDEIARRMGKSYKAAESTLSRARKAFQVAFTELDRG